LGQAGGAAALNLALVLGALAFAGSLEGYWTNAGQSVVVRISDCENGMFCGNVVTATDKARADARRGGTENLIGTRLLSGVAAQRSGGWRGTLFVPDLNRRSTAELRLLDENRLRIRGCAVGKILCRSQVWYRIAPPTNPSE
jgi:uncharacterized protein (DUF2147 family)